MLSELINLLPADYTASQWLVLCLCAVVAGLSKTGLPGSGILMVPLIASAFPARASTGLLLPILAIADIFAVGYYHRHAKWGLIAKLLPAALIGVAAGSIVVRHVVDMQFRSVIGAIVLVMLVLNFFYQRKERGELNVPQHWLFATAMGFFAGLTTQLANAAGPIMVIYFLAMRLEKYEFIGTRAWYFLIVNWLKIPIFISEGRITLDSVYADIVMIPLIFVGAFAGILLLKKIPAAWFKWIIQILAAATALKLLLS